MNNEPNYHLMSPDSKFDPFLADIVGARGWKPARLISVPGPVRRHHQYRTL
jgi:hypothetical protein